MSEVEVPAYTVIPSHTVKNIICDTQRHHRVYCTECGKPVSSQFTTEGRYAFIAFMVICCDCAERIPEDLLEQIWKILRCD